MVFVAFGALVLYAGAAHAQSASQLSAQVAEVASRVSSAESNESAAGQVISELDRLEALYAKVASEPSTNQMALEPAYHQLESALSTLYNTYKKKKDDCIAQIDAGGQCDYSVPEQLSLQALYPLSWLRFQGATSVYANNEAQAKRLLNEAIDGFTESTLVIVDPNLVRENMLGRAPDEQEIASHMGLELEDYQELLGQVSAAEVTQLELVDVASPREGEFQAPDVIASQHELVDRIADAVDFLPERLRLVVCLYYQDECSLKEIGAILGVTESRACQLHSEAIHRMRAHIEQKKPIREVKP